MSAATEGERDRVLSWIERGKQVGVSVTVERSGRRFYTRVAIQKQRERYKVIVDEIDEALMDAEEFEREEIREFERLSDAVVFIEETTAVELTDLKPSKGGKWF